MDMLIEAAKEARKNAYAPYSGFKVGAAVLGASGRIYTGVNVENVSYGLTNCAERTAVFSAVSAGEQELKAIAIIADVPEAIPPCGACRQVMAEFGIERVIMANLTGWECEMSLEQLLPHSFNKIILTSSEK